MRHCWVMLNGVFLPGPHSAISAQDAGFRLGDGVFETCLVARGAVFRLEAHLGRLAAGADGLGIPLPDPYHELPRAVEEVIERNRIAEGVLRIILTRGERAGRSTLLVCTSDLPDRTQTAARGARIDIAPFTLDGRSPLRAIKSTSFAERLYWQRHAARNGFDEYVILNQDQLLTECIVHNVFMVIDGVVKTPSPACGLLDGITRRVVLEICDAGHIPVEEGRWTRADLCRADEVFLTSTISGVLPVAGIGGGAVALDDQSITEKIRRAYASMIGAA